MQNIIIKNFIFLIKKEAKAFQKYKYINFYNLIFISLFKSDINYSRFIIKK